MLLQKRFTVIRHRLDPLSFSLSNFQFFKEPLRKLGFRPVSTLLAFPRDGSKPTGAYLFKKDQICLFLFFSKHEPFRMILWDGEKRIRFSACHTIEDFENQFARYFKIPCFVPDKRPVITWPPRKRKI